MDWKNVRVNSTDIDDKSHSRTPYQFWPFIHIVSETKAMIVDIAPYNISLGNKKKKM